MNNYHNQQPRDRQETPLWVAIVAIFGSLFCAVAPWVLL